MHTLYTHYTSLADASGQALGRPLPFGGIDPARPGVDFRQENLACRSRAAVPSHTVRNRELSDRHGQPSNCAKERASGLGRSAVSFAGTSVRTSSQGHDRAQPDQNPRAQPRGLLPHL